MTNSKIKITWSEKILFIGDKFKSTETGEILEFINFDGSPFQNELRLLFKTKDGKIVTIKHSDVEKLD